MTVPSSKVKAVCSQSEAALVRASRKGQIEHLDHGEVKRHAARARKLFDKWQGQSRSQSRTRGRKTGFGEADANTQLKAQIFGDALESFEARLVEMEASGGTSARKARPTTKRQRSAEHRTRRAAIRKGMTAVEDLLNAETRPPKAPARAARTTAAPSGAAPSPAAPSPPAPEAAKPPAKKPSKRPRGVKPPAAGKGRTKPSGTVGLSKQRAAVTAAKQSRVARSGKTTRVLGHVAARGKRHQARRDAKG